jgi:hypothetical protein
MIAPAFSAHLALIKNMKGDFITAKFDKLSKGKQIFEFSDGARRKIFFVEEGDFLVKTKKDNKLITIVTGPFVIGLVPTADTLPFYLEKVDNGKISSIDYNHFWSLVNYRELLPEAMSVISCYHTEILSYIKTHNSCAETHTRNMIERWNKYPSHIRKRFSLLYFLSNSSHLSKSTLCRVIKRLKDAGNLQLERGKLEMYDF